MNDPFEDSAANQTGINAEMENRSISRLKALSRLKPLYTFVKIIVICAIFFYIFRYLYSNWGQLRSLNIHLNYFYVVLSFVVMKVAWMTTAWSWGKTLEAFGHKIPYRDVYTIYFRSMLAKYLPGKVWQIAGSTYIASQKGVPEGATIASVVIGQAYSVLAGVALIVVGFALGSLQKTGQGLTFFRWTSIPILIALIILVVRPGLCERLMNWVLPLFKRQKVTVDIKLTTSLWLFLAFLLPWFIFGFSFWLLTRAFTPVPFSLYVPLTAILTAGTVIGFLAIFAPGGIGVKEASMAALAASLTSFPATFALAVGLAYRIVTSIVELIAFGITWIISKPEKKPTTSV
jgi:glycosyltransferase 2 family protein